MYNAIEINRRKALKLLSTATALALTPCNSYAAIKTIYCSDTSLDDENHIKDYLIKIKHFDETSSQDYFLDHNRFSVLKSATRRLRNVQNQIGYANFGIIGIDEAIRIARLWKSGIVIQNSSVFISFKNN